MVASLSLESTSVFLPEQLTGPAMRAVEALVEEIEKRTQIRLPVVTAEPAGSSVRMELAHSSELPQDGFALRADGNGVILTGNDERGLVFAVGQFLRTLHLERGVIRLPLPCEVRTAPRWSLRGHQLGYRPLPNSYTGWDVPQWDQYIRELALWGSNAIELLPPNTGGPPDSPHFPLSRMEMMVEMARIAVSYGMDVWIWFPALDGDYSKPELLETALSEWSEVFSRLCRVDAVFVPGGDPGNTPLHVLLPFLEKQRANLRRFHPEATLWLSPQGFKDEEMDAFFAHLQSDSTDWLDGVVFGPWVHQDPAAFRQRVPDKYPVRFYPDITHTRHCQYPVPDWDLAFALTQGREPTCPRPEAMANILRRHQPHTDGAICYSEGCHDDVNKAVWSALSWNPDADVAQVLREYARFFIGPVFADPFAQGLLALERNWQGALVTNQSVTTTLQSFRAMEDAADPHTLKNWRFLQPLFRAYCDAYTRLRLIHESALEERAMDILRQSAFQGSETAVREAEHILDQAVTHPVGRELRTRIFQLAEALYQTCHHKLSVKLYHALHTGRGAHLDSIDWPLNSRLWLMKQFRELRKLEDEGERLARIAQIVDRTNPGPGGFYDNPGALPMTPRLVRGPGPVEDPLFLQSSMAGSLYLTQEPMELPYAWMSHAWALNDAPIEMLYKQLDPDGEYTVQVVYAQTEYPAKIRLVANDVFEVHGFITKPDPVEALSFHVPHAATRTGTLKLTWHREPGEGADGQGCQISEIWLMRNDRAGFDALALSKWKYAGK
jgi:hypothetical protein